MSRITQLQENTMLSLVFLFSHLETIIQFSIFVRKNQVFPWSQLKVWSVSRSEVSSGLTQSHSYTHRSQMLPYTPALFPSASHPHRVWWHCRDLYHSNTIATLPTAKQKTPRQCQGGASFSLLLLYRSSHFSISI